MSNNKYGILTSVLIFPSRTLQGSRLFPPFSYAHIRFIFSKTFSWERNGQKVLPFAFVEI